MEEYKFMDEASMDAISLRMEAETESNHFKEVTNTFRVLGDDKRLKIVTFLSDQQELCVYEIAQLLDASVATTSHHLMILKDQGIIQSRKKGKHVIYSLDDNRVLNLIDLAAEMSSVK